MIADAAFAELLEDSVAKLLERHLTKTKDWYPHEYRTSAVPAEPTTVPSGLRSALFINLLTEDNLPAYTSELERRFGRDGAWGSWARRWTAEEGRHSIALREWLHSSGFIDPYELEQARMSTVEHGVDDHGANAVEAIAYVAIQELATRVAHGNTGRAVGDEAGRRLMQRIAVDENLHFLFYRDLIQAFVREQPSEAVVAIESVVRSFEMPGVGIPGYRMHAAAVADAGIYDLAIHLEDVLRPVLRYWAIESLPELTPEGEMSRDRLFAHLDRLERIASRMKARRSPIVTR